MEILDRRIRQLTRCAHVKAWESRVLALLMTLKDKLLDNLRRLIRKRKLKYPKTFICVVLDHLSDFSGDCDAEILQYLLQDFNEKFLSNINHVS